METQLYLHLCRSVQVQLCFLAGTVTSVYRIIADIGGLTRSESDHFFKVEMVDEHDDNQSVISSGCLPDSCTLKCQWVACFVLHLATEN